MVEKTAATTKTKGSSGKRDGVHSRSTDDRISKVQSDPRFKKLSTKKRKTEIDDRFNAMLSDPSFRTTYSDSRSHGKKQIDDGDELKQLVFSHGPRKETDLSQDQDEVPVELVPIREADMHSDSSLSDDEVFLSHDASANIDVEEVLDAKEIPMGDITCRFAVVNLNWELIKASHLLKLFESFKPQSGSVLSVRIYPSEFGLKRMKEEEVSGPPKEIFKFNPATNSNVLDPVELRKYELEKMRFFYAVVECDSIETARHIYNECDGLDFEGSSNKLDLRFIPVEEIFDEALARDVALDTSQEILPVEYHANALEMAKVKLSWDQDDPERAAITRRAYSAKELDDVNFRMYLASSSSEEETEGERNALRNKFRSLFGIDSEAEEAEDPARLKANARHHSSDGHDDDDDDDNSDDSEDSNDDENDDEYDLNSTVMESGKDRRKNVLAEEENEDVDGQFGSHDDSDLDSLKVQAPSGEDDFESDSFPAAAAAGDDRTGGDPTKDELDREMTFSLTKSDSVRGRSHAEDESGTVWEKYVAQKKRKQKERKRQLKLEKQSVVSTMKQPKESEESKLKRKVDLELLTMDVLPSLGEQPSLEKSTKAKKHFNMRTVLEAEDVSKSGKDSRKHHKKSKKKNEDPFVIDTADSRFESIYDSSDFAIDPTNPQFKKTKGMAAILEERQKRVRAKHARDSTKEAVEKKKSSEKVPSTSSRDMELVDLVQSVKRSAKNRSSTEQF